MATNEKPDPDLVYEMYNKIRKFESANLRTQKYDDKKVVNKIVNYIDKTVDERG